jgi:hypothetical protein
MAPCRFSRRTRLEIGRFLHLRSEMIRNPKSQNGPVARGKGALPPGAQLSKILAHLRRAGVGSMQEPRVSLALHRGAHLLSALPGCAFARRRRARILARRERATASHAGILASGKNAPHRRCGERKGAPVARSRRASATKSYEAALESYNYGLWNFLDVTAAQKTLVGPVGTCRNCDATETNWESSTISSHKPDLGSGHVPIPQAKIDAPARISPD